MLLGKLMKMRADGMELLLLLRLLYCVTTAQHAGTNARKQALTAGYGEPIDRSARYTWKRLLLTHADNMIVS